MSVRDDLHEKKDLVIGTTGAVVLAGLVVMLFFVRGVAPGPGAGGAGGDLAFYRVTFEEEDHPVDIGGPASGQMNAGETREINVTVDAANVTAFRAELTWPTGGVGDVNPDTFSIAVEGPSDAVSCEERKSGTSGALSINCSGVPIPRPVDEIAARNATIAEQKARPGADRRATGEYLVTITLEDTNDGPIDDSNSYELSATYTDFHPRAERVRSGPSE